MLKIDEQEEAPSFGQSITGMTWCLEEQPIAPVMSISQKLGVSEILARVIYNRGVQDAGNAKQFIDSKIKDLMVDPLILKDMEKATNRIAEAIKTHQNIVVFGDYDVDGATSSALLRRFFKMLGIHVPIYIPNRLNEGYGPTPQAIRRIKELYNPHVIITVDCGTSAFEAIDEANSLGITVVVIDHHLPSTTLPNAHAIINPNRLDDDYPEKSIAAVGVSFMFAVAVRAKLRQDGFFTKDAEPDLLSLLDLVALGTVCDVMPLRGINRAFVKTGLRVIASRKNLGISVLSAAAKIEVPLKAYHLGFALGPRINAGGRVGEGHLGAILLSTDDHLEATEISMRLEQLNQERKAIEAIVLEEAINNIEQQKLYNEPVLIIHGQQWHVGILGIIASRIKERYAKPTAVISINDHGLGKGSARSITGIDLGTAIANAKSTGLLLEGGGHSMAGGFVIEVGKIPLLRNFFQEKFAVAVEELTRVRRLHIDAVISIKAASRKLYDDIEQAGPFGNGNQQPRFAITDVVITKAMAVGANHLMFIACDDISEARGLKCMHFRGADSKLGQFVLSSVGKRIDIAGVIQPNYLHDNRVDFVIDDIALRQ